MSYEVPFDEVPFTRMAPLARRATPGVFAVKTYEEIAAALAAEENTRPLSVARIAQIEQQALRKLRRILQARGIMGPADILPEDPV